jgi:hypothetical protein
MVQAVHQLFDGFGLVAGGLKIGDEFEIHVIYTANVQYATLSFAIIGLFVIVGKITHFSQFPNETIKMRKIGKQNLHFSEGMTKKWRPQKKPRGRRKKNHKLVFIVSR